VVTAQLSDVWVWLEKLRKQTPFYLLLDDLDTTNPAPYLKIMRHAKEIGFDVLLTLRKSTYLALRKQSQELRELTTSRSSSSRTTTKQLCDITARAVPGKSHHGMHAPRHGSLHLGYCE